MTDEELLGTPEGGRCMDCKWFNNSAVVKACGCARGVGVARYNKDRHFNLIKLARVAKKRRIEK